MLNGWIGLVKKNLLNTIGIFIIVLLTVFLGTLFLESNQNITREIANIKENNLQDFTFYPSVSNSDIANNGNNYLNAINGNIEELSKEYDFNWDNNNYKIIKQDSEIFRLYSIEQNIDKPYFLEGASPKDNEICIDYNYAKENKLEINDNLKVLGQDYRISGICVFTNQLAPIIDNTGILYDKKNQGIIGMDLNGYTNIKLEEYKNYIGKFNSENIDIKNLENDERFSYFIASEENMQIFSQINSQKTINIIIMSFSMGILGMIAVLILIMTIIERIKSELSNLGVLKALGYSSNELSVKYLTYFFIVLIPAIIGYLLGNHLTPEFYKIICSKLEIPFTNQGVNSTNFIIFTIVPAIYAAISAYLTSMIYLRKPPLSLIKEVNSNKANIIIRKLNSSIKDNNYLKGVRRTIIYSNILLLIFVLFGGFSIGVQIQFAYTTYNMTSSIEEKVLDGVNYKADIRYLDKVNETINKDNLYYCSEALKIKNLDNNNLSGIYDIRVIGEGNSNLLELFDKSGEKIDLLSEKGIVINQLMALQNGLKKGDKVELIIGNRKINSEISNISKHVFGTSIYVNTDTALSQKVIDNIVYNGSYTNEDVEFNSLKHMSISNVANVRDSVKQSSGIFLVISIMLFVFGLVVGATVLWLSIHGVINNYKKYIALMHINGYTDKECRYTVISGFRNVSIFGFLISIPYTMGLCYMMFDIISKNSEILYPVDFNIKTVGICFILTVIITELIILIIRNKIKKISFREIMEN